ncbi:MAG: hypothetical protein JWM86_1772 [Thermoleophilia bacterium]|nr:hypothetical protein [Thermoleophilia bacterium]
MTGAVGGPAAAALAAAMTPAVTPAAAVVADNAANVAPVVVAAAKSGMSGTGWFGLSAGAAGIAITLLDAWKDSVGSQKGITAGSVVNPATVAIGGGAVLLTIGEKTGATSAIMRNGLRSAGIALVLGGLAGAIAGAMKTFGNPLEADTEAGSSSQSQAPVRFGAALPPAPQNLEGVEVASADVIGEGRKLARVPVYVDPATARQLPVGITLGEAIGQARAATQADELDRSHAVIQTVDGAYWIMRLSGQLDQVDGRNFAEGTKYDDRYDPQIGRRQQAVQAIAGVESHYVFPQSTEATAPVQYTGDIPWVTPELPKATTKPVTPAAPTTPATPATPAAATTTTPGS